MLAVNNPTDRLIGRCNGAAPVHHPLGTVAQCVNWFCGRCSNTTMHHTSIVDGAFESSMHDELIEPLMPVRSVIQLLQ